MSKYKGIDEREIKCCDTSETTIEAGISFDIDGEQNILRFHFLDFIESGKLSNRSLVQETKSMWLNKENTQQLIRALKKLKFRTNYLSGEEIAEYLLQNGFKRCYGHEDYDCVMPIHVIHSLYYSSKLSHFAIGVFNEERKKESAGVYKQWHYTLIPKPIYTIEQAQKLIDSLT